MVVKKIKIDRIILVAVVLLVSILSVYYGIKIYKNINYKKTFEYKLLEKGYDKKEAAKLEKNLKNIELEYMIKIEKNSDLVKIIDGKYFMLKNFDEYLEYYEKNKSLDIDKIIALVNTKAYTEWSEDEKDTDITKSELMLVNRFYGLKKDYYPEDIVSVPETHAYQNNKISKSILEYIISLIEAGKGNGFTFVVSQGYRSYKDQNSIYESYKSNAGQREADKYVAKPGHSEYQTGLSFTLVPYNREIDKPYESEEYIWLWENAHLYGFIFRLPEGKNDITLFNSDAWRLRYVGVDAATYIHKNNITFEEYYAYFLDN